MHLRYSAAACQTDLPNPTDRRQMRASTERMLSLIDSAVAGSAPFLPVRLVVFPEFAHAAPVFATVRELLERLTVPIPNEHTDRLTARAREHDIYIQSGSMLEEDPRWPGVVFNTTCLIGPTGILYKYRKVNPWIPYEVHSSPHDLPGYDEPLFPVADTPIGRIGCAICYDWLFPEVLRQLTANGAEVLVRVSAYMDPWGATGPMSWWTLINRARAIENTAYVVAANQGASLKHYPPYSWPGGSQVVDFDGRMLAEASPGPGERIVVAPIDVSALRHERATRVGHHMLAHLRTEAYDVYRTHSYPPQAAATAGLSYEENVRRIQSAKIRLKVDTPCDDPVSPPQTTAVQDLDLVSIPDPYAKWTAAFDTQIGEQKYTYDFQVKGSLLTGTASSENGTSEIKNGKVDGDVVTFLETLDFQGMKLDITYTGKIVSADQIDFTRQVADVATEKLVAKRVK